jgi:hypothetical protein
VQQALSQVVQMSRLRNRQLCYEDLKERTLQFRKGLWFSGSGTRFRQFRAARPGQSHPELLLLVTASDRVVITFDRAHHVRLDEIYRLAPSKLSHYASMVRCQQRVANGRPNARRQRSSKRLSNRWAPNRQKPLFCPPRGLFAALSLVHTCTK